MRATTSDVTGREVQLRHCESPPFQERGLSHTPKVELGEPNDESLSHESHEDEEHALSDDSESRLRRAAPYVGGPGSVPRRYGTGGAPRTGPKTGADDVRG